jgi:hypothetical protein
MREIRQTGSPMPTRKIQARFIKPMLLVHTENLSTGPAAPAYPPRKRVPRRAGRRMMNGDQLGDSLYRDLAQTSSGDPEVPLRLLRPCAPVRYEH